jgi:serine/threonine-protein kinase
MIPDHKLIPIAIAGLVALAVSAAAAPPPASPGQRVVADDAAYPVMVSGAGALPERLGRVLTQTHCVLASDFARDGGAVGVSGFAGRDAEVQLHQQLTGIVGANLLDWQIRPVDPVFCDALGVLRPVSTWAGAPISGLAVTPAGGITTLHDGQRIRLHVTMSDFAGELRVDYLVHDGSVMHLYPACADRSQNMVADPTVTLPPQAELSLGERSPGHPGWEVGPPYGTDMIMAVASTAPLLTQPQTRNADDNAAPYLRELANGVATVRRSGGRVAGTLLFISTVEK